jgi:hypothetical protein
MYRAGLRADEVAESLAFAQQGGSRLDRRLRLASI